MKTRSPAQIAEYFGVAPALVPHIPELFADFYELGSYPDQIAATLAGLRLPASTRALDVGCGKGAVSIELARTLGWQVHGVDLVEAFVSEARERAAAEGLAERCSFERRDALSLLESPERYDVVLLISVGEVFGALDATVRSLRGLVRSGGYLVIDDGYLREGSEIRYPGWETLASREETLRRLTSSGDTVVEEWLIPAEQMAEMNRLYNARIRSRVEGLRARHPELSQALDDYVALEREQSRLLETSITCATWLLRVADRLPASA